MPQILKYLFIIFLFHCSCNNSASIVNSNSKNENSWIYLKFSTGTAEFSVLNQDDSLLIKSTPGSLNKNDSVLAYKITASEKDSLFKWVESLIDSKMRPTHFCTDYYGKLSLKIVYNEQVVKNADYTSICEWQELDSDTKNIYQLITKIRG